MSHDPLRLPLPDDAVTARALDLGQFLKHDEGPPSIEQAANDDSYRPFDWTAKSLCAIVGSAIALEALDAEPHLDDGFDWSGIADQDRERVAALLDLIDHPSPIDPDSSAAKVWEVLGNKFDRPGMPWVDDEYRTIIRRILRLLALHPDRPLDRRCKPTRLAAAIVWVALDASGGFLTRHRRWKARDLWDWFGVSSCVKIGRELVEVLAQMHLSAEQLDERSPHALHSERSLVGSPELLHSRFRTLLIDEHKQVERMIRDRHAHVQANQPIQIKGGNRVELRSRPTTVRWATKGATDQGRATILVALGEDVDELELLALSVTDARRLISVVEQALSEPLAEPACRRW